MSAAVSSRRVSVAVNLLWLAPGRVGGSEEYLVRQLAGLDDPDLDVTIHCAPAFAAAHSELTERFETAVAPTRRDRRSTRILAEHTWLPVAARTADVVHHGGGTVPAIGSGRVVVTVHDLQYRRYPEYFSRARREYLARMMPRSVRRADVVTVPTEYVRRTVVDAFGVDPERVRVVPHGIPDLSPPSPRTADDVRRRYGLADRPFVVYPAITHPHKGHELLVGMLDGLDADLALVLVGGAGAAEDRLRRAIAASGHADRVVRPGRVPGADRDALLSMADALVFPSRYEGFGAPLVEAMALDTPVVCSAADAVREVAGDAAVVVETPEPAAWAAAVGRAISDRDELVARGRARRRAFTPEISGAALAAAYRRAAGIEVPRP